MNREQKQSEENNSLHVSGIEKIPGQLGGFKLGPISLQCPSGTTLAVLGPNGSGKSTLFNLLAGQTRPDNGQVTLGGQLTETIRRRIGYLPQQGNLPHWATPHELCTYSARLLGDTSGELAVNTLRYWDCFEFRNELTGNLSTGMRKRVGLAVATLNNPDLLILDEPFEALDLGHVAALRQEIKRRTGAGLVTVFATHIASFAAELATTTIFLTGGKATTLEWPASVPDRITTLEIKFLAAAPPPPKLLHPCDGNALP